jgi:tetratricopeptide (TPR) repeat protein
MGDEVATPRVLGVYSKTMAAQTGVGATAHDYAQKTYWFVRRLDDDNYEVQPLNGNHLPSGLVSRVGKGELIRSFSPELDYYQKKTLPCLQSLQRKIEKGEEHLANDQLDLAEKEFCKAVLLDDKNVRANMGLGEVYCRAQDRPKLKKILDVLLSNDVVFLEEQRRQFNAFGMDLRKNRYLEEAKQYYEKALAMRRDDEHLRFNLARVHYDALELDACIEQLNEALRLRPDFTEAKKFLGHCLRVSGQADDAPIDLDHSLGADA